MKRLSLQMRLTLMTAALLAFACLVVYLFISNSALMRMDQIESNVVSIQLTGSDEAVDFNLGFLIPELQNAIQSAKTSFRIQCLLVTIGIILIGSSMTWVIAGVVLRPLRKLSDTIDNITENNLSESVPVPDTHDEIADLTVSFNRTLTRLDQSFQAQKQFTANAAHELRTPLAVMQTDLEVLQKKASVSQEEFQSATKRMLQQISRLGTLVNTLLELLSMHSVPLDSDVELTSLVEEILCDLDSPAEQKSISLSCSGTPTSVRGNDTLLYRAIYNLTENAIKYSPDGSAVQIEIKDLHVDVIDNGPGIPKEYWNQIFEPFFRIDKARSRILGGAGLGLALVKTIAEVHGGSVGILKSDSNGTVVRLSFER